MQGPIGSWPALRGRAQKRGHSTRQRIRRVAGVTVAITMLTQMHLRQAREGEGSLNVHQRNMLNLPSQAKIVKLLGSCCTMCCRHGRRHAHRRHEDLPNQAAAPAVVATGVPADSPVFGYPEIYKAKDEEPERRAHPVHRRHHARRGHGKS